MFNQSKCTALVTAAGLALFASPGFARSFSPAVNAHIDATIPSNTNSNSYAPEPVTRTWVFSPAVNGQVTVTVPLHDTAQEKPLR